MIPLCAERGAAVILTHGLGKEKPHASPGVPEDGKTDFSNRSKSVHAVMEEIALFLHGATEKAIAGGIGKDKIILDPGFGFGKSTADNLALLSRLARIGAWGYPLLIGLSRKRFIGEVTGRDVDGRLAGTIAANTVAILGGADIIRVHDTAEAADVVKMIAAITQNGARE
jgi:dihydropteroate synthase